ncbi:hypothetical protein CGLAMM_03210 [Acetobacteraceae bacterium EV16G]|uniref:Acid phosphatase n=1 Tax=Sorlinia euscelidii TaxID=3081148 RepID=A0ABU7U0M1_9PROT
MRRRYLMQRFALPALASLTLVACQKATDTSQLAPLPNGLLSVPPPPAPGSLAQLQDQQIFTATRQWKDSPRWKLAVNDDDYTLDHALRNFSCAAGFEIDTAKAPHLRQLARDVLKLEAPTMVSLKRHFARQRPFVGNDAPTCMVHKAALGPFRSYPSGHTMMGTTLGFLLASLMPDHADALYMRARIYGESRIVCGAHWASDVEAGFRIAAQQTFLILMRPEIKAQLPAVRKELDALRAENGKPDAAQCALEKEANAHSPNRLP